MTTFEKINLKPSYFLFNSIEYIDISSLSINKKHIKSTDIVAHEIKYITKQNIADQCIDRELPLCFSFSSVYAYIIKENKNKYLIFALTENNKKGLEMHKKLWNEVKKQIECNSVECNSTESIEYEKDPIKIKFDSFDDDLLLNKILWFSDLNIIVESVFQIKDNYYPQIHIHECEWEEWY